MISGGEGAGKCYRTVHAAGREPWAYERPCTPQEIAEKKVEVEGAKTIQNQLEAWNKYLEQQFRCCAKKFGGIYYRR